MASIKNFELKNIKRTLGREGYGATATMYLNGKKIGAYADYGDGAGGECDYISKKAKEEMMKLVIEYAKTHPNEYIVNLFKNEPKRFEEECEIFKKYHSYIPDEDITMETMSSKSEEYIVCDLLKLVEREKILKRNLKKGYRAISFDTNTYTLYPESWTDERIKKEAGESELYMSLKDFNI